MLKTKITDYSISKEEYRSRCKKVLDFISQLAEDEFKSAGLRKLVLKSGSEQVFSNDVHYPFRVNSDFHYLTGFTESEAVLILDPRADNPLTLYIKQADKDMIIWEGERETISSATDKYSVDVVYDIKDLKDEDLNSNEAFQEKILKFIHSLRAIKSSAELNIMRRANEIAIQGHSMIPDLLCSGVYEYEIEAQLNNVFRSQGANGWSYPAIVASGKSSCILHYIKNNQKMMAGDLVLVDAGAEFAYYASDITRVFPVEGGFTDEQRDIYDLVLKCQEEVIRIIKAGMPMNLLQEKAFSVLGEGLQDLKYISDKNNLDEVKKYFMHGIGHSLGIDVHDPGLDRKTDILIEGMVITIEPGLYVPEKAIGVRIEDNIVVTRSGYENLTAGLNK
ncbi:MAG: M24 family metallopeptidase [bacterium]